MTTGLDRGRRRMVERQIAGRGIVDRAVLRAMGDVPRERFLPDGLAEFAYDDAPLPIGEGQTISQPFIVARMIEAAELEPGDKVLEVGAGSGYAAAVMGRIAGRVFAIERHATLAAEAGRRLASLGCTNVTVSQGDGTRGLPEEAPFDAVIVSASGPAAPRALKDQLAIGGRLVVPVGDETDQRLIRITRRDETRFDEDDIGGVRFVPLIGEGGWPDDAQESRRPLRSLPQMIRAAAEALPGLDDPAFADAFDRFADRKVVLLGEASHGTSEFYRARAAITKRLVERHGFTIVAVEADWPDAAIVDRHVRHKEQRPGAEPPFRRFPTWMWRNTDVAAFVAWLRDHNGGLPADRRAGFYGLDIYNLGASIDSVLAYLDEVDPEAAAVARERYGCLTPWQSDPSTYGRAVLSAGYRICEAAVVAQCRSLLERQLADDGGDADSLLDAKASARLVAAAERYYRTMYYGHAESWNLRDRHMFETLDHVLDAHGPNAKAVVWAHNSHIGDARQTAMGQAHGELNLGQLCRERFGENVALVGFGTHAGTVAASSDWGGEMEVKEVRPSLESSVERLFHDAGGKRVLVDFQRDAALARRLAEPRPERFIGVIYRPETERQSHYAEAALSRQFDAFVWFDESSAVTPLGPPGDAAAPETYPFGL